MNDVLIILIVPAAIMVVGGMIARMYHQTELALFFAFGTQSMLILSLFCIIGLAPESTSFWLFVMLITIVTAGFYWWQQIRTFNVQDFRDQMARSGIPIDRLKNAALHTHSKELCKWHTAEHLIWE